LTRPAPEPPAAGAGPGALRWLTRWGISLASLVGGLATLFVFRRGLPHVGWLVGYLLLLWLVFAILTQARQALEASPRRRHRLVVSAADYTIQTLYHGLLLFVLPAYWAAATLTSLNATFVALVVALALLTTFDPWYRALVQPRPWLQCLFFVVSVFAALNVALPLIGLPPFPSLVASAFLAVTALTPAIRRVRREGWPAAFRLALALAVVVTSLAAAGRAVVPPAPLFMARASLGWEAAGGESQVPDPRGVPAAELHARGLVAHTAIYAPAGLRQPVVHVWRHEGREVERVPLSPVLGGRREGFRTYSRKTAFPQPAGGRWTVDVITASGQLVGRLSFRVVP
jgi:hypothetical protein